MPFLSETFSYRFEADLAAEFLAENDISARVSASDAGGSVPALQPTLGVRLEVADIDFAEAERLVSEWRGSETADLLPLSTGQKLQGWFVIASILAVLLAFFVFARGSTPPVDQPEIPFHPQTPW
jgi:hypothetical protein